MWHFFHNKPSLFPNKYVIFSPYKKYRSFFFVSYKSNSLFLRHTAWHKAHTHISFPRPVLPSMTSTPPYLPATASHCRLPSTPQHSAHTFLPRPSPFPFTASPNLSSNLHGVPCRFLVQGVHNVIANCLKAWRCLFQVEVARSWQSRRWHRSIRDRIIVFLPTVSWSGRRNTIYVYVYIHIKRITTEQTWALIVILEIHLGLDVLHQCYCWIKQLIGNWFPCTWPHMPAQTKNSHGLDWNIWNIRKSERKKHSFLWQKNIRLAKCPSLLFRITSRSITRSY